MSEMNIRSPWPGWQIARTLGGGSFGAVYEIHRSLLDGSTEKAAMKVISLPKDSNEAKALLKSYDLKSINQRYLEDLTDIVKEYGLMSQLKGNVNIVHCEDLHHELRADGIGYNLFIKMELLTPADQLFGRNVQEAQVIRLGMDICNALVACRKNNIIHRDIKPANIMVSADGTYKLGDFGIAKNCDRTSDGTFAGTLSYMAPEVYHNKPYGASVDIYSLGMVLYVLLNENVGPFLPYPPVPPRASEMENARQRRFNGEALPAPKHGSDALKRIVLKACAFRPAERYASAEEMLAALRDLSEGSAGSGYSQSYGGTTNGNQTQSNPTYGGEKGSGGSTYGNSWGNETQGTQGTQGSTAGQKKATQGGTVGTTSSHPFDKNGNPICGPYDARANLTLTAQELKQGCSRDIHNGEKTVRINIPAGTNAPVTLYYNGLGKTEPATGTCGRLFVKITVQNESPDFWKEEAIKQPEQKVPEQKQPEQKKSERKAVGYVFLPMGLVCMLTGLNGYLPGLALGAVATSVAVWLIRSGSNKK